MVGLQIFSYVFENYGWVLWRQRGVCSSALVIQKRGAQHVFSSYDPAVPQDNKQSKQYPYFQQSKCTENFGFLSY